MSYATSLPAKPTTSGYGFIDDICLMACVPPPKSTVPAFAGFGRQAGGGGGGGNGNGGVGYCAGCPHNKDSAEKEYKDCFCCPLNQSPVSPRIWCDSTRKRATEDARAAHAAKMPGVTPLKLISPSKEAIKAYLERQRKQKEKKDKKESGHAAVEQSDGSGATMSLQDFAKDLLELGEVGIEATDGLPGEFERAWQLGTVSYTHLTLPTICSV